MDRGFSLLETMVALSVFSLAAMGLVSLNTQSARISTELEARQLAQLVANNVAAETVTAQIEASRPVETGEEIQRRRTFRWTRTIEPTPRPGLYAVEIDVVEAGRKGSLAKLSLLTPGAAE